MINPRQKLRAQAPAHLKADANGTITRSNVASNSNYLDFNSCFGVNAMNIHNGEGWESANLRTGVINMGYANLRYPGGDISKFFNWQTGKYFDYRRRVPTPHPCLITPIEYFQSQRDFPMIDNTPASVTISALNVCAPIMPVLNNVTAYPAHQFALPMTFQQLNTEVKNIEIGVEQYNTHCENLVTFPTPADYAISTAQWINAANALWPILTQNTHNNYKFAVSGNKPYEFNTDRRTKWNEQIYPYLNNTAMLEGKYSIILHPYMGSGLSGLGVNNTPNINEMMVQPFQYYDNFLEKEIHQNIKPYGINHYFNTTKPDIWITEGNMFSKTGVVHGSWAAALFTGTLFLKMMEENQVKILDHHAMAGNFVWADYFNSNDGYITGDFDAPDADGNTPGLQVPTTINLNGSLTLQGHVMRMIGSCFRNAAQAHLLNFTGVNMAVPSYTPIGTTAIYPMLYGWEFATSSATDNQILLLNLTDQPQSIDVSSFNFNAVNTLGYQLAFPFNSFLSDDNNGYYLHTYGNNNNYATTGSTPDYQQPLTWSNGYIILPAYSITKMQKCINTPPVLVASTTEPCNGLPFSIKVVNNKNYTGNYTWVSSNNASTTTTTEPVLVTNGITANTTYTVTVDNCSSGLTSSSILINSHTTLTATLTTTTTLPLCNTGNAAQLTATLSGSSTFKSYAIYALDGADPAYVAPDVGYGNTNNIMFLTNVHPTATTQYQVTASDGVCAVTSPPITITVVPKLEITPYVDQVCTGIYTDLAVDNTFTNVAWTGANIIGATNNPIVTINPATNTTYTVTATSNSCTQTVTKNITPVQCCTTANAYVMPAGTVLDNIFLNTPQSGLTIAKVGTNPIFYDISPGFPNTSITINDQISIDAAEDENAVVRFFLTNPATPTEINMAERARIIVKPYNSVILKSTNVTACTNYLWRGFDIESYGSIQLDEQIPNSKPTISDAEYAIKLANDSKWKITSADFLNNYVSVYIPPTNLAEVNNNTVASVAGADFSSNANLKLNYTGQLTPDNNRPYAGLLLYDDAINIGNGINSNTFTNLNHGVRATRCILNVQNTSFNTIRNYEGGFLPFPENYALYIEGDRRGYASLIQTGLGQQSVTPTFNNCITSIFASNATIEVSNNKIDNTYYAIQCRNGAFVNSLFVHDNTINASNLGIYVVGNDFADKNSITNNTINLNKSLYSAYTKYTAAIALYQQALTSTNGQYRTAITNNNITLTGNVYDGIFMNGVNYGFVKSNTVTINDDNTFSGIRLNGGKHNTLSCNDVIGTNKTTSFSHGIATWASQENTYKCNNVDKTRNGFYFNEDCKGTTFEGNCIGQHYNGVMVDGLATLPPLVNTGNKWSKMSSDYTNFGFNSLILMGQCKFNPNTTIDDCFALRPSQALPPSMSGVNFIPNTLIPEFDCPASPCTYVPIIGDIDEVDRQVAKDSIVVANYKLQLNRTADKNLYSEMADSDSLRNSDTTMQHFYYNENNTAIGQLDIVSRSMNSICQNNGTQINFLDSTIHLLLNTLKIREEQLSVSTNKADSFLLEVALKKTHQKIVELHSELNSLMLLYENAMDAKIDNLRQYNANIITNEGVDINEQAINELFLSAYKNGGNLNPNEMNQLNDLAQQCPPYGGNAVMRARAKLASYNDSIIYNDSYTCSQVGITYRKGKGIQDEIFKIGITPNPAKDVVYITLPQTGIDLFTIKLLDMHGRILRTQETRINILVMDISHFANGCYCILVKKNEVFIANAKVIIYR